MGVQEWGSVRGEGARRRGEHQREQGFREIDGLGEGDSVSERLGAEGAGGTEGGWVSDGRGCRFRPGAGEGSDRGSGGQRQGQFGEQCVHTVYPLQPGRRRAVPVEVAPEQRPGAAWAPAPPSQLRDPKLIIMNEQLGLVSWHLYRQHISTFQRQPSRGWQFREPR